MGWRFANTSVLLVLFIIPAQSLNLGLIAGDNKRLSSPLLIKKVSKLSPVFININSGPKIIKPLTPFPKLPPKPPPLKLRKANVPKLKRSLLTRPLLPPLLPPLPILPILPPILPPLLPILPPLLPILPPLPIVPPLPILPPILKPLRLKPLSLKPLQVPILGKSPLKHFHLKKPENIKGNILTKLIDLKLKSSLTGPEFLKFKKLLVK